MAFPCSNPVETKIPKVSVGMPIYNVADVVENAIQSILDQTFTDFELIISDNNSTDETTAICERFALSDPRIRLIKQPVNMGGEANFKFVLDQAKGEYFTWAASDDMRTEGFLEKNIAFLEKHPDYSFSCASNCFIGEENEPEKFKTFDIE
jgi:glycosyltransferase involved in cell wall biosynthesis